MLLPLLLSLLVCDAGIPPKTKIVKLKKEKIATHPLEMPRAVRADGTYSDEKMYCNPSLPGSERFPNCEECRKWCLFLNQLESNIQDKLAYAEMMAKWSKTTRDPILADYWERENNRVAAWLQDIARVRRPWEKLKLIRQPPSGGYGDKESWKDLHKMLGEKAWWEGAMPQLDYRFFERRER